MFGAAVLVSTLPVVWLLGEAVRWRATFRANRRITPGTLARTFVLWKLSFRAWLFPVSALMIAGTLELRADSIFHQTVPAGKWVLAALMSTPVICALWNLRPPSALLLASGKISVTSLMSLRRKLRPLRVAVLFPPLLSSPFHVLPLFMDNFRTLDESLWQWAVRELTAMVPVVIVDTRLEAGGVLVEIGHLIETQQTQKAIFVVCDDGSSPLLDLARDWQELQGSSFDFAQLNRATERACTMVALKHLGIPLP